VGEVRRVVAAAPRYLALNPAIEHPADLAKHQIVAMTHFGVDSWSFPPSKGSAVPRAVHFTAAPDRQQHQGRGRRGGARSGGDAHVLLSYRRADPGLRLSRSCSPTTSMKPIPVHLLAPHGRMQVPKVRAFVDFAVPRLKAHFARLTREAETAGIQPVGGRVSAE